MSGAIQVGIRERPNEEEGRALSIGNSDATSWFSATSVSDQGATLPDASFGFGLLALRRPPLSRQPDRD